MTVYGFENKKTAEDLARLVGQPGNDQTLGLAQPLTRAAGVWMMEVTTKITTPADTTTPGEGKAKIKWRNPSTGSIEDWEPNGQSVTHDVYSFRHAYPVGEIVKVVQYNSGGLWAELQLSATEYRGLVNESGGFDSGDTEIDVDNLLAINGIPVHSSLSGVKNIDSWAGDDNDVVWVYYNGSQDQWEIDNIGCDT